MKAILAKWWALAALSLIVLGSGCSGTDAAIALGAVKLGFETEPPTNVAAGQQFMFTVELQNASDANVPTSDVLINVTFVSPQGTIVGAGGGATNAVTNAQGMATFAFSTETAQTLTFNITTPELDGISGTQVIVDPGTAVTLAYGTAPASTAVVDQAWTTFTLEARDNLGNVVTGATGNVTIGKLAGGGGAFTNATKALTAGVATFNDLSFDAIESVDLDVSTTVGTVATLPGSVNVDVQCGIAGTATQIAFGRAPAAGQTAGVAWVDGSSMSVTVEVQDCFGDVVGTDNATMISTSVTTGDGFTVGSTTTRQVTSGVATFDNLVYNKAEDVTLDFTTTSLPDITDVMVTVGPAAISSLSFTGAPSMSQNLESTSTMSVPVDAADAFGNAVAGENIMLSIQTNPGTGTLRATSTTVSTSASGTATFGSVGIDKVGSGYVLRATHMATMTTADSASFNIIPGPVSSISFAMASGGQQPPSSTTTDASDDFTVKVRVRDFYSNNVADGTVMTLTRNGGTFPTTPVLETDQMSDQATTTSGVATWTGVNLTKVGTGAMLRASGGATNADSSAFNVTHGVADHLAFGTAPTTPATDTVQWEDFTVRLLDVNDNIVTSNSTNTVTVAEMSAGSFTGTTTQTLDAGVATFNDLVYNLSNPSVQEVLSLTTSTNLMGVTGITGTSVTVEPGPVPAQVAYYADPFAAFGVGDINPGDGDTITETVNQTWAPIVIEIQDSGGERAFTDSSTTVTLSVTGGTGTLGGTLSQSAVKGRVIFDDLTYDVVETVTIQIDNDAMLSNPRDAMGFVQPQVSVIAAADVGLDIERASLTDADAELDVANNDQAHIDASVSNDGRFVAFSSLAALAGETNLGRDIFVRDRVADTTEIVSVDSTGMQSSFVTNQRPSISANGRFVAFESNDSVLLNASASAQIVVKDRDTGEVVLASRASGAIPTPSNGACSYPAISADGRYVAFASTSTDLVENLTDNNGVHDVFVRDLALGTTELISKDTADGLANGRSGVPMTSTGTETTLFGANPISISADGRYVAFQSYAFDLVAGDTNLPSIDVFVRDRVMGSTVRVNLSTAEVQTSAGTVSQNPSISADGRYVAFDSTSSALIAGDTNGTIADVFVRDTVSTTTVAVSLNDAGTLGNAASGSPSISADGRYVAFDSADTVNLREATNGNYHVYVIDRDPDEDGVLGGAEPTHIYQANRAADGSFSNQTGRVARAPALSANGAYVAFQATETMLVSGDSTSSADVFIAPVLHDFAIFVTNAQYQPSTGFVGVAGADALCNATGASAFGMDTVWVAWLSTESVNAPDRIQDGMNTSAEAGRWYRAGSMGALDSTLVANSIGRYSSGSLLASVQNDEDGNDVGTQDYWTGTTHLGVLDAGFTCTNWTVTSGMGRPGQADQSGGNWTNSGSISCGNSRSLLCIQTD